MAKVVLGIGASHSPMLTLPGSEWDVRAQDDRTSVSLNLSDGRMVSYAELVAERGEPYAQDAVEDNFIAIDRQVQAAIDRLADDLIAAAPDVVLIIGDDEGELFDRANMPAVSIFYGDELVMSDAPARPGLPDWMHVMARGYAMDAQHRFPVMGDFARELIERMMDRQFDVGAADRVVDAQIAGFGHAFGFVIQKVMKRAPIPVIPVLLNTYFSPNVMTASRAYDFGAALSASVSDSPRDLRVAVIASGGLSHFVTDVELDRRVLQGLEPGQEHLLRSIPRGALLEGSSEILNWIAMAGTARGFQKAWSEYFPVFRTPAGTGVGVAFGAWRP